MNYNTVIFDIDGTLIDSAKAILSTLQKTIHITTGKLYDYSELHFALGLTSREALRRLVGENYEEACLLGQKLYGEYMEHISLFDGMSETLFGLHNNGIRLGIVTSKTRKEFARSFHYPVLECFDCCICADDTNCRKPDPKPLLACLLRLNSDRNSCLYVGDSIYDYECAKNAGIDFGLALWGSQEPELIPARLRLLQPADLCDIVDCGNRFQNTPWQI